jgi:hypothetical protein
MLRMTLRQRSGNRSPLARIAMGGSASPWYDWDEGLSELSLDRSGNGAMRLPRFRMRTTLLLVMLIAVGLWAESLRRRMAYCLATAARFEQWRDGFVHMAQLANVGTPGYDHPGEGPFYERRAQFYESRVKQYRLAAYRPRVAVPDDPAEVGVPRWHGPWR